MRKMPTRHIGDLPCHELSKKGHTEHSVCNNAIQSNAVRGLLVKMDRIVVAGCLGVATKLLLRNGRFDQRGKLLARGCMQNTHRLSPCGAKKGYKTGGSI